MNTDNRTHCDQWSGLNSQPSTHFLWEGFEPGISLNMVSYFDRTFFTRTKENSPEYSSDGTHPPLAQDRNFEEVWLDSLTDISGFVRPIDFCGFPIPTNKVKRKLVIQAFYLGNMLRGSLWFCYGPINNCIAFHCFPTKSESVQNADISFRLCIYPWLQV